MKVGDKIENWDKTGTVVYVSGSVAFVARSDGKTVLVNNVDYRIRGEILPGDIVCLDGIAGEERKVLKVYEKV